MRQTQQGLVYVQPCGLVPFFQNGILIMLPLHLPGSCLSSSQNSLSLVAPPMLPAWLLANQHFIKPIRVTNLCSVQKHYPTAAERQSPN